MENRPIHKNLDTSFVNLSALIRYLRRRQFIGNLRVELRGYEADVILTADNQMKVLEHDRVAGRISEGEDALQRLLIRAREPGGIIHVYQKIEEAAPVNEEKSEVVKLKQPPVKITAADEVPRQNANSKIAKAKSPFFQDLAKPGSNLLKTPFKLNNNFESQVRQTNLEPTDWQTLLNLTAELLRTIDKSLAEANLDFAAAFSKARIEISADYPFLNPAADVFNYQDGKLIVREQINARLFAASVNEILRRILEKLGKNPKLSNIYRIITERIRALVERRKLLYDKFSITPSLEKVIRAR